MQRYKPITLYQTGNIPQEWGGSVICPIYKNKGDFLKCENYRGISLLNDAFKIYESVLERRLRNIVEEKLGPWQHGFRRGNGTTDMTFVLRQLMEKHWEYDMPMYLAFLGPEKAFVRVPRKQLWYAIGGYEIPSVRTEHVRVKYE